MKRLLCLALVSLFVSGPAQSQSGYWRDSTGVPLAETESMKSSSGFAGSLLATMDADWEQKWNTPPETKPNFIKADTVPYGKKVFILTFFSNPKLDDLGSAEVRCDIQITSPAGKVAMEQRDMNCFSGKIKGSPYNLYLSEPVIAFSGDPEDPPGIWKVDVVLRDARRNVELPLRTSFELR
jgi:hypothetical protein